MKITDIYDEDEKSAPFLLDIDEFKKKVIVSMLLFVAIVFISCSYWIHTYYSKVEEKMVYKQRLTCSNSTCRIIYLNKHNIQLHLQLYQIQEHIMNLH